MKRITIIILTLLVSVNVFAQQQDFWYPVYFHSNVYLPDFPTVDMTDRIPTGGVVRLEGAYVRPSQDLTIQGSLLIETNRTITMPYKDAVAAVSNGVIIRANGEIELNRFVSGVGWSTATINPTNPLPTSILSDTLATVMTRGSTAGDDLNMDGNHITYCGSISGTSLRVTGSINAADVTTTQLNVSALAYIKTDGSNGLEVHSQEFDLSSTVVAGFKAGGTANMAGFGLWMNTNTYLIGGTGAGSTNLYKVTLTPAHTSLVTTVDL